VTQAYSSAAELKAAVGQQLGPSSWAVLDQVRIDHFAEATGDHQWIHVDPERARSGPFGGTIAHGYLTLSVINRFLPELMTVSGATMGVNYGLDKVRFPAPVRAGSRIRARAEVLGAEDVGPSAVQLKVRVTIEIEGGDKPACVADTLSRFFF